MWFEYLNTKVPPMNNVHCRMAVEYAANKTNLQTAYGGPFAGGAIAVHGDPAERHRHKRFDLYEATTNRSGDIRPRPRSS